MKMFKWKLQWLQLEGMRAVRVCRAIIKIQKVLRGHWVRSKLAASRENGIDNVYIAVTNAVVRGMRPITENIDISSSLVQTMDIDSKVLLTQISTQLHEVTLRLRKLENAASNAASNQLEGDA